MALLGTALMGLARSGPAPIAGYIACALRLTKESSWSGGNHAPIAHVAYAPVEMALHKCSQALLPLTSKEWPEPYLQ